VGLQDETHLLQLLLCVRCASYASESLLLYCKVCCVLAAGWGGMLMASLTWTQQMALMHWT
jgi:hypothetical protein